MNAKVYTIGDLVSVRGITCRIYAILPAGTVEVEAVDGSDVCFRVSGLPTRHDIGQIA